MKNLKILVIVNLFVVLFCSNSFAGFGWGSRFDEGDLDIKKNSLVLSEKDGTPTDLPADNAIKIYAKDSAGDTKVFTIDSLGNETELGAGGGGGVSNGDKGDITVSGGGSVWTIDNLAVSTSKINWSSIANLELQSSGFNWSSVPANTIQKSAINWTSVNANVIQRAGINWDSFYQNSASGLNWSVIPGAGLGKVLTLSTAGVNWSAVSGGGGSGDIEAVGDCTTGSCFDGSSGTTITGTDAGGLTLKTGNQATTDANGADVAVIAGNGNGVGLGGDVTITSGQTPDQDTYYAGAITIQGATGIGYGEGGYINIYGGDSSATALAGGGGGLITIRGGDASEATGYGQGVVIVGGDGGGAVSLTGGAGTFGNNNGATATISGGAAAGTGVGGAVLISGGLGGATSGNGGAVTVEGGYPSPVASSGTGGKLTVRSGWSLGTNQAGSDVDIQGGRSRGNANGGNIVMQITPAGSSGSSLNTYTTVATVKASKAFNLAPISSAPASPASGDLYVDSSPSPDELCFYDGAAWQGISSGTDANCA